MNTQVVVPSIASPTWNREEVEQTITRMLADYTGVVYTPDTVKSAKADRAELNRIAKALDDERKRVKAEYTAPFEKFEREVKAITEKIKACAGEIDAQVKAFEEAEKQRKLDSIRAEFLMFDFRGIEFEKVFDQKWLNATVSMSAVRQALTEKAEQVAKDFEVLETIEEYQFEATESYKRALSLAEAMRTVQARKDEAKRKAEHEARLRGEAEKQAEKPVEEKPVEARTLKYTDDDLPDLEAMGDGRHAIAIHAKVTNADEVKIMDFLNAHGIEFYILGGNA